MKVKKYPSQERIKELFYYKSGNLIWKSNKGTRAKKGMVAGFPTWNKYILVGIDKVVFPIHNIIWLYFNKNIPLGLEIDHINRIRTDNRIENLRLVTRQENSFNQLGKGYYLNKPRNKFMAYIRVDGKLKNLGMFRTEQEAQNAYLLAKEKYHNFVLI